MDNVVPLRHDMYRATPQPAMGLGGTVYQHLEYLRLSGKAPSTVYARHRALIRLQAAMEVPLLEATEADVMRWRAGLAVDSDTVRQYVSHVHQFYVWAVQARLLAVSPAEGLPVPARTRRLPRPISDADLFAAIAAAPERILPWLVLAAWCGLRAKEIALLRRECVLDTARPPLIIIAYDATKGHRERVVPICSYAAAVLIPLLPASGWTFRRFDGLPGPNSPARVSKLANEYLHGAGILATLHQLRHWFGSNSYKISHDLRAVQDLMGHAKPETTAGYVFLEQSGAAVWLEDLPTPGRLRAVGE
jgi:integrase